MFKKLAKTGKSALMLLNVSRCVGGFWERTMLRLSSRTIPGEIYTDVGNPVRNNRLE